MRAVIAALILAVALTGPVAALTGSRSTLTEGDIRSGEVNCMILERAQAHGIAPSRLPTTAGACRLYLFSLRRP